MKAKVPAAQRQAAVESGAGAAASARARRAAAAERQGDDAEDDDDDDGGEDDDDEEEEEDEEEEGEEGDGEDEEALDDEGEEGEGEGDDDAENLAGEGEEADAGAPPAAASRRNATASTGAAAPPARQRLFNATITAEEAEAQRKADAADDAFVVCMAICGIFLPGACAAALVVRLGAGKMLLHGRLHCLDGGWRGVGAASVASSLASMPRSIRTCCSSAHLTPTWRLLVMQPTPSTLPHLLQPKAHPPPQRTPFCPTPSRFCSPSLASATNSSRAEACSASSSSSFGRLLSLTRAKGRLHPRTTRTRSPPRRRSPWQRASAR